MDFAQNYGTPHPVLPSSHHLQPPPAAASHKQRGFTRHDTCAMCKSARGSLWHVLSSCGGYFRCTPGAMTEYSPYWMSKLKPSVGWVTSTSSPRKTRTHASVSSKKGPHLQNVSKPRGQKFLAVAVNWKMAADLKEALHFPHHILHTQERSDIVIWSDSIKRVIIVEVSGPGEENIKNPSKGRNPVTRIYAWSV